MEKGENAGNQHLPHFPAMFCGLQMPSNHTFVVASLEINDDVIHAVEDYSGDQDSNFFQEGLQCLNIVGPSALMLRGLYWKIVKSYIDCATLSWGGLEVFEWPSYRHNSIQRCWTYVLLHVSQCFKQTKATVIDNYIIVLFASCYFHYQYNNQKNSC